MTDCNEFRDSLPMPEELPPDERHALERHLASCETCRERASEYRRIVSALETNERHPGAELLARYAVHRCDSGEPDFDGTELSATEIQGIENHLASCDACREAHSRAVAEYNAIDAHFESAGLPETLPEVSRSGPLARIAAFWRGLGSYRSLLYVPASAAALVLLWMSPLLRGPGESYYALAALYPGDVVVVVRGASDELAAGLAAFSEGRFAEAIDALERYVQTNETSAEAPYARLVLGLAYLHTAKTDFLGRAHRVDVDRVDRGLAHLEEAARTTESRRLLEDAWWFLAKGHLMNRDAENALEYLDRIEELGRRRAGEARALAADVRALAEAE